MPELMLIEETAERAAIQMRSVLTLVQLSFEQGEAEARCLVRQTGRVIDPEASCYYHEARSLLLRAIPNLGLALIALDLAASLEPVCYGPTHLAIRELVIRGARDTARAELMAARHDETNEQEPRYYG